MSSLNHNQISVKIKRLIEANNFSEIRLNANGGNSILIVYEPDKDCEIFNEVSNNLDKNQFQIIDISELLLNFIKSNAQVLELLFDLLQTEVSQIFKAPSGEERPDFFRDIIDAIENTYSANKVPVLVNTGGLYGTGIESINIMENEVVMKAGLPLVILYPATQTKDSLAFLGKRHSSKYRCMIIS